MPAGPTAALLEKQSFYLAEHALVSTTASNWAVCMYYCVGGAIKLFKKKKKKNSKHYNDTK